MTIKRRQISIAVVLFVAGFAVSLTIQSANDAAPATRSDTESSSLQPEEIQDEILAEQEANREIAEEISAVQREIASFEDSIAAREEEHYNQLEDIERLRMITGDIPVSGEGVEIRLDDSDFNEGQDNPNEFIVHERHIQKVVDELYASGAEAVAVNGQRLANDSYIYCVGPVVEVDGYTSFAPFEITAIGDAETLEEAVNLGGGVRDQLVNDNVQVRTDQLNETEMAGLHEEGAAQ
ncbi:DUF881 domain-containing protein [Salisediminibacterium halotolerans]|uniref:DUF881 domain-containing protein n=1 Tax=Salisediminibacterium halotolerans TaxID=517425 RepID=UPI000EB0D844|nr:DUF881 domain-containing protein [Salisediminibacterium halotolerans]RLJ74304.1 uncharacterized protein YlxW (UPF0749 family) [Actinophytocola xinjiangensis]RPE87603.1 uncharacterized protein YlxW (UPF0749 family) [Salisediminibacterium halotolerans]TWG35141.1 uncharacterized protein YlxW (UPF0749 family) [Salisediminibacterium halotolerans]GEL07300.1 UPF0749 protein YlxW [Salisediminibacterium halotolerans]